MKIYNNSDLTLSAAAQSELQQAGAWHGAEELNVILKSHNDDVAKYEVFDENEYPVCKLDDYGDSAEIYA